MYTVWMKDAIDEDRIVLSDIQSNSQANALIRNLKGILPDSDIWLEEE